MLRNVTEKFSSKPQFFLKSLSRYLSSITTVDDAEIKHFERQSPTWWDEVDAGNALYAMNTLRIPFIRDGLINTGITKKEFVNTSEPLTDLKILDVGCGGGYLSESLARLGCKVIGLDASGNLITMAQEHAAKEHIGSNLIYVTDCIEEFSSENVETFDAVVASEVIEHVNDQIQFVSECAKCLKPGGSIFFTTLNKTLLSRFLAIYVAETVGSVPAGTHDYEKFIEPHLLYRFLENNNCCVKILHGMSYNFFTNNWSWSEDTSIFYALHAVKIVP